MRPGNRGWRQAVLLALLSLAFAAHGATRAWLDRERIELGETVTLNIETDQPGAQPPGYDALLPDFAPSGHSSRRSVDVSNGQRREVSLFAVALSPRREGVFTIPALRVGGEATQPLQVTVVPASVTPARAGEPAFIEAEPDTRSPYVQQSVGYVLRLYYATPLVSGQLEQPPPDGASMQRIGSDLQYTREIGGQRYTVVERRFQIVPERSGTLAIPGARFEGRGVGGFFDDVFGGGQRELRANGPSHVLQVQPMPDGAPQPWLPLHALEMRYLAAPQTVRAGEATTVVVEVVADGAIGAQLPELQLPVGDGAQVFAEPAQIDETFDKGRLRSRMVRRFSVVPAQAGALRVPGPRMAWWDVRAGVARTASLPDLRWQVEAGGGPARADVVGAPAETPRHGGGDAARGWWPWLAGLFALLWLATAAWAWHLRRRTGGAGVPAARTGADATHDTRRLTHRRFMQLLQAGDLGEIDAALCALPTPPVHDLDALASRLADAAQRDAVAALQAARWGGGDAAAARAALRAAFAGGPKWNVAADAGPEVLPPLYPRD
jgi:hypothetical protein